jgi:hypothetical protein
MEASFTPGHIWMQLLRGRHVSTDVVLVRGVPQWRRHTVGKSLPGGMFDYWKILAGPLPALDRSLGSWLRRHLRGFTGVVNFETIGGGIIECHLRMSEQWIDINGPGWLASVVDLYAFGRWRYQHRSKTGYSIALFGHHETAYTIDPLAVAALRRVPGLSSIQITFDPSKPREQHAMPPGGFRLAILNCWSLAVGLAARERLKRLFTVVSMNGGRRDLLPAARAQSIAR